MTTVAWELSRLVSQTRKWRLAQHPSGDIPQNINFAINAKIAHIFFDAHKVEYTSSPATGTQTTADIAEAARSYVFPVLCIR